MTELFLLVLEGFVLNLLNTTVVDFVAAVHHSSKLLCLLARWASFIHMDLLARSGFCWQTVGISTLISRPACYEMDGPHKLARSN
jgi:hypothetical protein